MDHRWRTLFPFPFAWSRCRPCGKFATSRRVSQLDSRHSYPRPFFVQLSFDVVTPNGDFVTATACQNKDLFFALRGGGGSTFGVITSSTTTAAPQLTIQAAYFKIVSTNPTHAADFLKVLIGITPALSKANFGGYIEIGAITSQSSGFVLFSPTATNAEAVKLFKPVFDYAALPGNIPANAEVTETKSFFQAYNTYLVPNEELVDVSRLTSPAS